MVRYLRTAMYICFKDICISFRWIWELVIKDIYKVRGLVPLNSRGDNG